MKQKVLYMTMTAWMLLACSTFCFAKGKKKVEDPEITKLKGKIENVMSQVDKQPDLMVSLNGSLGNHQHANGISLELYARDMC